MPEADTDDLPAVLLLSEAGGRHGCSTCCIDVLLTLKSVMDDLFADWLLMKALRPTHMFYLLPLDAGRCLT